MQIFFSFYNTTIILFGTFIVRLRLIDRWINRPAVENYTMSQNYETIFQVRFTTFSLSFQRNIQWKISLIIKLL